jgi:hypothetical protein
MTAVTTRTVNRPTSIAAVDAAGDGPLPPAVPPLESVVTGNPEAADHPDTSQPGRAAARRAKLDSVCALATDLALAAAEEVGREMVGPPAGVSADGERLVTHRFAALQPGYLGWYWTVTVARAPRSKHVTVSEVALLPGSEALLAPEWVPWSERLRPGDLGVGDLLPTAPDDDRLVPGFVLSDDPAVAEVETEIGFGRPRVMSRLGREETADRWYTGRSGPENDLAKAAPARCVSCGFYLQLAGSLGGLFGACGNLFAPDDGRVVSADHGCGAHSEALVEPVPPVPPAPMALDDDLEVIRTSHSPGSVEDSADAEPLGHG